MKPWLLLRFLTITNFLLISVMPQNYGCFGNNYTTDTPYSTNLNTLLKSLSPNIDSTGFYNASEGHNSGDTAYAAALCRTDYQLDICRSCVQNATTELLGLCPNRKQGVLFNYICTLRYSDESMFRILRSNVYTITARDVNVVSSDPAQFNEDLRSLVDALRGEAASGGSAVKIAAGSRRSPDFQTIFALLQCMPDISSADCTSCLFAAEENICCNSTGLIVYMQSCTLEYKRHLFYNMTRIQQVRAMVPAPVPVVGPSLVPPTPLSPGNENGSKTSTVIIIIFVSVVASLLLVLVACVGYYYLRKSLKKSKQINNQSEDDDEKSPTESLRYEFGVIKTATNDFSDTNKLGEGGFGSVYKGKLENGQEIAVKRLARNSGQGDIEFKNEVMLMAKLQHKYLVRLLGFSLQGTERLLIYELIQNSSLDAFIFDPIRRLLIDWDARYKIIKGIARGLLYLHEDSSLRIIHRDLKASNILLDGEMNPKIADFGMARMFMEDESKGNTRRIVGTYGYMPPEYARHGEFSVKLDVFSFGVLVLEIVSGKKNSSFHNEEDMEYMISFAWKCWRDGRTEKMIDPMLMSTLSSFPEMLRCIHIGLLCVQENAVKRPTMASVVLMLSSSTITSSVPSKPAYFIPSRSSTSHSNSRNVVKLSKPNLGARSTQVSKNDVSLSEFYPR